MEEGFERKHHRGERTLGLGSGWTSQRKRGSKTFVIVAHKHGEWNHYSEETILDLEFGGFFRGREGPEVSFRNMSKPNHHLSRIMEDLLKSILAAYDRRKAVPYIIIILVMDEADLCHIASHVSQSSSSPAAYDSTGARKITASKYVS